MGYGGDGSSRGDPISPIAPMTGTGTGSITGGGGAGSRPASGAGTSSSSSSSAPTTTGPGGVVVCPASSLPLHDLRAFLTSPAPKGGGFIQCYIERDRSGLSNRMYPVYSLYLLEGHRFLLAGRKRSNNKTSNYMMCMDKRDLNRDSEAYMGKLRGNFVGTSFVVYDDGIAPDKVPADAAAAAAALGATSAGMDGTGNPITVALPAGHPALASAAALAVAGPVGASVVPVRRELAVIEYASNVLGSRGPRKMRIAVPKIRPGDGRPVVFNPLGRDAQLLSDLFKAGHTREMVTLVNKQPKWNDAVGAYVLNFNGRVTMASVKNFQLVSPEDEDTVLLQFGRTAKEEFTMDFQWPLSPLQAFAICLSSFDYKLACE